VLESILPQQRRKAIPVRHGQKDRRPCGQDRKEKDQDAEALRGRDSEQHDSDSIAVKRIVSNRWDDPAIRRTILMPARSFSFVS